MEYVQSRVATLHDLADPVPAAPVDRAAVVVPMAERDCLSDAADRVLGTLERSARSAGGSRRTTSASSCCGVTAHG